MQQVHLLQSSRFEYKYLIDEALVRPLRDFARGHLDPDPHADPCRRWEYDVHSLYLDSPSFSLCRATLQGQKNRFKLRIRFYDDDPDRPVFFEVKRRKHDVILKERAAVWRHAVGRLLAGQLPDRRDLVLPDTDDYGALQRFCHLRQRIAAEGRAFVSYRREAYVTPDDNTVRMTFDRHLVARPFDGSFPWRRGDPPRDAGVRPIVLELKFTDRFPVWLRQMVRTFDLERRSMAKYVWCVRRLRAEGCRMGRGAREICA